MRLQDYPKPKNDNGRGVHWIPYTWGQFTEKNKRVTDDLCDHLRDMNIRWVLILNGTGQEWRENEYLVRKLVGPNPAQPEIMPIIRIGERFDPQTLEKRARGIPVGMDLNRVRQIVAFYRSLGVSYFQLYNEPNHIYEWPNRIVPPNAANICADVWLDAALTVIAAGGLPGFPPPSPGGQWPGGDDLAMLAAMLDRVEAKLTVADRAKLYDKMWVGIHNYFLHRPILSLPVDSHGFKKFVWYQGIIAHKIGHELPILTGEGGLRMGHPPYGDNATEAQVAASTKDACRYMSKAPEYYFCNCFWLVGSAIGGGSKEWEAASWFRKHGSRQQVVTALKRLGEYCRDPEPPEEWFFYRNGYDMRHCHIVKGSFLREFNALGGLGYCGFPTSSEIPEGDMAIQGFEKLTLMMDPSGQVHVRGQSPRKIVFEIPSVADLLAAQELSAKDIERALAEVATTYGLPETLTAGEYQVQLPGRAAWRNQDIINAFWIASGRTSFGLLERAGISLGNLVTDRQAQYTGPPIEDLASLSEDDKERILAILPPLAKQLITFRIPTASSLLEAQGLNSETIAAIHKLIAVKYGPLELLVPGDYTVSLPPNPIPPLQPTYINQEIINAFWIAGAKSWVLLNKAGLDLALLASDRQGTYTGPAVDDLPNLTDQERSWLKAALPEKALAPRPTTAMATAAIPLDIVWEPAEPTSFTPSRHGHSIDMIILHATGKSWRDTLAATRKPTAGLSPHYVIDKNGKIYQLVKDTNAAHHCSLHAVDAQRDLIIQPNYRSLGIALVNWGQTPDVNGTMVWDAFSEEQYESLSKLIHYLCQIHSIRKAFPPLGPDSYAPTDQLAYFRGILGYSALDGAKKSPGPQFDWGRLRAAL